MIITKAGNKYVITDTSGNFYASTYSSYDAHLISMIPEFRQFVSAIEAQVDNPNWIPVQMRQNIKDAILSIQKEIDSPRDLWTRT